LFVVNFTETACPVSISESVTFFSNPAPIRRASFHPAAVYDLLQVHFCTVRMIYTPNCGRLTV
jgi:hypothetical protein